MAFQNLDGTLDDDNILCIGLAQIAPVWLDRAATLAKVESYVDLAARQGCRLVAFGRPWFQVTRSGWSLPMERDSIRPSKRRCSPNMRLSLFSLSPGTSTNSVPPQPGMASPSTWDVSSAPPIEEGTVYTARWHLSISGARSARSIES